jgi:hypothetical protein
LTVRASTLAAMPLASTPPFTVCPTKRTPAGTRTTKSTRTSLSRTFERPPEPGSQVFGFDWSGLG